MEKIIRYYNQNRRIIWLSIMVIVFALVIIQLLNSFYAEKKENNNETLNNNTNELSTFYEKKSEAMVQGNITSDEKKKKYAELVDDFLNKCVNGNPDEAYQLLSNDCKELLYPTEKAFEQQYYSTKFSEKKNYDFQLWSAVDRTYIYLVKIYNDMLSTGIASTQNYIQDYFSVVQEDNVYKLNISGFVKNTVYGKVAEKDGISINVKSKDSYMDYEIYHIKVTNYSDSTILLDPISEDDTVYIRDDNDIIFNSMLIEMIEDDLLVKQGYTKDIDIKFVRSYTATTEVKTMKFTKIIKNYEKYLENKEKYEDFGVVKIDLK